MTAIAKRDRFQAQTKEEEAAWLRTILVRQLADQLRKLQTQKRNVGLEVSLQKNLDQSSAQLEAWLTDSGSSCGICQRFVVQQVDVRVDVHRQPDLIHIIFRSASVFLITAANPKGRRVHG